METIKIPNAHKENSHYNPCTEIAVGTSLSLGRTISGTPPNRSSLSLSFKIEESAILKLGTANNCLQIASDGMALVANGTSSSNFQDAASKDMIATAGNWHHLAWIKNNDQHTLYLNGIACQTQTLAGAPNPATIDTITSVGANAYVVHLHGYDRALEATEVVADKMSQYNATKSFTDQYPLNFTLKDRLIEGAPEMPDDKLIIEDIAGKERTYQRLVITNVADETLKFVPNTNAVSKDNHHFELRFRNGTFVSPSEYPKFDNFKTENLLEGEPSGIPSGWQATLPYQNPQDGSWSVYVLRTVALDLDPNERLEFPFEYTSADGSLGGRSTRVSLRYNHIQYAYTSYIQWQPTKAYKAGSYVFYEQVLYKAKQDIDTNAAWNTEHWENMTWQDINAYTAGDVVVKESGVYMAKDRISAESWNETQWQLLIEIWRSDKNYSANDKVVYENGVYKAKVDDVSGNWNPRHWEVLDLIQGIREKQIDIINNSSNNAHVSALNQKVTEADAKVDQLEGQSNKAVSDLDSLFDSFFSEESEVADKDGNLVANPIKAAKDEAATAKSEAATAKSEAATANKLINDVKNADETGYKTDQGKINGRVTALPALNKSSLKDLFVGILNALGILASNIKAVDDEVDKRGDAQDAINDMLEKPFPLVASVSAPQGVVCGDSGTSLQFKLTNIGNEDVSFNSNSEFRFIIPIGGDSADLAKNLSEVGTMTTPQNGSPSETGDTVVFKWKPSNKKKIASRTSETFTISGITPNSKVGFVTIFIEYQGIVGYPSGKLSVAISKVSKDIAQLVGGGNVGIGTSSPNSGAKLEITTDNNPLRLSRENDNNDYYQISNSHVSNKGLQISFQSNFYNGSGREIRDALVLAPNGNVGIGTATINSNIKLQVAGNVNTTGKLKEDGHDLIPVGIIVMWQGSTAPDGWALCNGSNGTPNLRNRFVLGYNNSSRPIGRTGGVESVALTAAQMPRHNHSINDPGHNHYSHQSSGTDEAGSWGSGRHYAYNRNWWDSTSSKTGITINHTGSGHYHENMPPYYVLAYIMKL